MKRIFPVCAFPIAGALRRRRSPENQILRLRTVPAHQVANRRSPLPAVHGYPRRDLQSILLVTVSNPDAAKGPSAFAVMACGTFDQSKITMLSKDGTSQTFNGVSLTVYPKANPSHSPSPKPE